MIIMIDFVKFKVGNFRFSQCERLIGIDRNVLMSKLQYCYHMQNVHIMQQGEKVPGNLKWYATENMLA